MSQIGGVLRNEPENERVRIPSVVHNCGPAHVLDNPDVAAVIRMDSFETTAAHAAVKGAQTGASSSVRVEIGAHLDDAANPRAKQIARFLGKKQRLTEWVPC